ncbi:Eukaryotic translation initiation factor 3 subunit K {ECO:0000255/HAMAP-Rule:MF_03010} Short=eIF3k {ECO:0000255/HAMAP-Rule:MF_03010}; AltName: Full=eIF-3 p25 {ECO:0000255/HAMAP-Rule:MF_03010} [Serendipita indica DSM 11827]|nr:Eukaryotic translation initiation factor 3 subunit K {ECO:0000255/HAMAP-Rule:MF_03010} Short=eIF3k {ECO:0000255/HAMAP-Rule:MF_03010}; AltName: Full=eIF-3 p25 {ECO:0000255/HAMAP-Rule:MF_03010} [Serendipita indica DSM 11827]
MATPTASATREWLQPSNRPEIIDTLISGVDRYNPSNVGILEDYLYHQTRTNEYDCLANLAILKLYQFNTVLYNADVVVNILLKALTATPSPDFNLCMALLSEKIPPSGDEADSEHDPATLLPILSTLSRHLQECQFPAFWRLYQDDSLAYLRENFTVEVLGFEDGIREVVVRAVKSTFTKIGVARLGSYLNLSGDALEDFINNVGWSLDANTGTVTIPPNPDNTVQPTIIRETITLPQLSRLIAHAT